MTPIKRSAVMFAEGSRTAQPIGVTTNEAAAWRKTPSDIAAARHASSAWNLSVAGTAYHLGEKGSMSTCAREPTHLHSERARHCDIRVKATLSNKLTGPSHSRMEPEQYIHGSRRFRWVQRSTDPSCSVSRGRDRPLPSPFSRAAPRSHTARTACQLPIQARVRRMPSVLSSNPSRSAGANADPAADASSRVLPPATCISESCRTPRRRALVAQSDESAGH